MSIIDGNIKDKYGKVVVILGGDSREREISLISGNAAIEALKKFGIEPDTFDSAVDSIDKLTSNKYSRAFLTCHGKRGEDGLIQGLLEYLRIPYTGSGVSASSIAFDKYRTKLIWASSNIPTPKFQVLDIANYTYAGFNLNISLPVVVKPTQEGSTVGVTKVYELESLSSAIDYAFEFDTHVLIEELIVGDEIAITIDKNRCYPLVKIEAPNSNYDYNNKYFTDDTKYICPYHLGPIHSKLEAWAQAAYNLIGARSIARLDAIVDHNNNVYFLELNTIPGLTSHSLTPMAFKAIGVDFDHLCLRILDEASLGG